MYLHLLFLRLLLHGAQVILHAVAFLPGEINGGVLHQRLQPGLLVRGEHEGTAFQLLQKGAGGGKGDDVGVQILPLQRPQPMELHGLVEDNIALFHGVYLFVGSGTKGAVGGINHLPKGVELTGKIVGVGEVAGKTVVQRGDLQHRRDGKIVWHRITGPKMKDFRTKIIFTFDFCEFIMNIAQLPRGGKQKI